ncbi:MAG: type II toxin-antitoxin system prevent-host-death family antitoxin [Thermoleophilia bacterium]
MTPGWLPPELHRRVEERDFGSARRISVKELRARLSEVLSRVAYGDQQVVVCRHRSPLAAIVPLHDLQACQAVEDHSYAEEMQRLMTDDDEEPYVPLDDVTAKYGAW